MELDSTLSLQQQVFRLQTVLEASRRLHATIKLDAVLRTVLEVVVRELEVSGAFYSAYPFSYGSVPPRFLLQNEVPQHGCARFPVHDRSGQLLTEVVVIVEDGRPLTLEECDFIESILVQAAIAIENARHHETALQWERVAQDLASARTIQRSLLPEHMPEIPGYSVAGRSVACYEVGGDYLDILPLPDGKCIMVVADVAGKGLASAIVGSSFRSAFRAMALAGTPLAEIARRLNDLHYAEGGETRRRYVTAVFAKLDSQAHRLELVNAGHNPAMLSEGLGKLVQIEASGTPIGMLPGMQYELTAVELSEGSRLLLYSDGLTEVFRGEDEFGPERLGEVFSRSDRECGAELLEHLWQTVTEFGAGSEQRDDMTALTLVRAQETGTGKQRKEAGWGQ
jgi:serine phosphatase RsbU (regulator of sigma subunit)